MTKGKKFEVGDIVVAIFAEGGIIGMSRGHAYKIVARGVIDGKDVIKVDGIDAYIDADKFARAERMMNTFIVLSFSPKDGHVLGVDSVASFSWRSRPEGLMSLFQASQTFSWLFYEAIKKGNKIEIRCCENEVIATAWIGDIKIGEVRTGLNPYRMIINE